MITQITKVVGFTTNGIQSQLSSDLAEGIILEELEESQRKLEFEMQRSEARQLKFAEQLVGFKSHMQGYFNHLSNNLDAILLQLTNLSETVRLQDDFPQFHKKSCPLPMSPFKAEIEIARLPPNQSMSSLNFSSDDTTVAKEVDFLIEETTQIKAHKVFDEMLEPEMKIVCMSKMLGTKLNSGAEENEDNDETIEDPNSYVRIFWKVSNIDDESKIMVAYVEQVAVKKIVAHIMRKCVGVASKSLVKNKSNETTWSFDPGGCHVFDESFEVQFVGLGEMKCYSLSWPQPMEIVSFLSTTNSPTSSLWNTFKNVKLSSISTLIELGIVIGSKNGRVLHAAASVDKVEWFEMVCSGFVFIDYAIILNYRFLSNSVISQHHTEKSLNNKTIHHRILAEWAEEPPDCTCFHDLSASEFFPSGKITLSFQSHLSVFYMSFEVTGRPFGVKYSILAASPFVIFKGFMVNSFIESIPDTLLTTELGTMFLEDGGYVVRQLLVWIQKCYNEVFDSTLHSTLFNLVQDNSIQVLEEISFVIKSTCETTSQLFEDSHSDSYFPNEWWKDDSVSRDFLKSVFEGRPETLKYTTNFNVMIDGYVKLGNTGLARRLFGMMADWNLCSWNIMIWEYCQNKQSHEVIVLFGQLFVWKMFELNGVTVVVIVVVVLAIEDFGILDLGS